MDQERNSWEGKKVRQRVRDAKVDHLPEPSVFSRSQPRYLLPTPVSHVIFALISLLLLSLWVLSLHHDLPPPLMLKDVDKYPNHFIAERAMSHLIKLTSLGPRSAGSYENEVLAVDLFKKKIATISHNAQKVHKIYFDIQKPSGAFPLHFLDGMTNVYRNVHNIIVKIGPRNDTGNSVLINCHFDSVPDSPGGSDDGASCAIMLEIFQVISESIVPLKNNIIFLFNGAEENFLQASHGFITQHPWASEVRTFVNMEACGAGGKEILFQAGPNHPWIMEKYSDVVPHPYASSLAQEIFQSGVIPGDTDFRIFRDFGNVSGLDFAWASNGYVYHTKYDNVDQIPLGTLQRTGENILALSQGLANAEELSNVEKYSAGNLIYFDFLGMFMVKWSETTNVILNVIVAILSTFSMLSNMQTAAKLGISRKTYMKQFGLSCFMVILTWVLTILTCILIALFLTALGRTMSWFSRPAWIFFLYICPIMVVPMFLMLWAAQFQRPVLQTPWFLFQIYHDAYLFMSTITLIVCTYFSIRSGFIALTWVFAQTVGNFIQSSLWRYWRGTKWLLYYCFVIAIPWSQTFSLITGAMSLFIPIMGRTGGGNNSELILGVITAAMFVLQFSFVVPLILVVRSPGKILSLLCTLFLVSMGLLIFTPLGFPYSGDVSSPSPQRFMIVHTQRVYHDDQGKERNRTSGFWMVDMDQNSPHSISNLVPGIEKAKLTLSDCKTELYCGLPYLIPVSTFIWKTHWIDAPPPFISIPASLKLVSSELRDHDIKRMKFVVTGPSHMGVMISPYEGVDLVRWSFVDGEPLAGPNWMGRRTYFVFYGCASNPEPWAFWIDLKGTSGKNTSIDMALSTHFLHGRYKMTRELSFLISAFPLWTATTAWTATFTSWKF